MGFVYRLLWILEALWIVLPETINNLRKLHTKNNILGYPWKFYHIFMYIAPSSGEPLPNLNLPLKIDSKEVWDFFLMCGVRMLHFKKRYWLKLIQIYQYYTMALIFDGISCFIEQNVILQKFPLLSFHIPFNIASWQRSNMNFKWKGKTGEKLPANVDNCVKMYIQET